MKNRIVFEDGLLRAMEGIAEQAEDDTTKMCWLSCSSRLF